MALPIPQRVITRLEDATDDWEYLRNLFPLDANDSNLIINGGGGIPESIVDAKGDLIAATADDTVTRLPVGTNTYVLTANSATATGLEWTAGTPGPAGSPGRAGINYTFDSATGAADPNAGKLRFNNATPVSATALYINSVDADGGAAGSWITTWDDSTSTLNGYLIIREPGTANYVLWSVGTVTDNGGWFTVVLTGVNGNGTFTNGDPVDVLFIRTGDKGDTGTTGSTGAPGDPGRAGVHYVFEHATTSSDPGAGFLKLNDVTDSLATALYIDQLDADGADLTNEILSWDDSTSVINGKLIIRKTGTAIYHEYAIGTVTNNTGWFTVALTHTNGNGAFSLNDELDLLFVRTGDKGDTGATGSTGSTGPTGPRGGVPYIFDNTVAAPADPGTGEMRANNASAASVTALYISETKADGGSVASWIQSWDDIGSSGLRGHLILYGDSTADYAIYAVSGGITDSGTYDQVTVSHVSSSGFPFGLGQAFRILFVPAGATGATGSTGSTGPVGRTGLSYVFDSSTASADPGSGELRLNNATPVSATALYINTVDADGGAAGSYITTWDDSTSTVDGYLLIREPGTTNYALWQTSTVTNNGGWFTVVLIGVNGSGTFANLDNLDLIHLRTGDKGDTGTTGSTGAAGTDGAGIKYCRAATTANITISTALNNADSLDGVTLATNDRVLVKDQSAGAENGIYIVGVTPTRATDFDATNEVLDGTEVRVAQGTINKNTSWRLTTDDPITVGTTAQVWQRCNIINANSTTWPTNPADGDIHFYPCDGITTAPTSQGVGVTWQFRYVQAENDWRFVGGPPVLMIVETEESTNSTSYTSTGFTAITFQVPFTGEYFMHIGARMYNATASAMRMSYDIGGTGAVDADSVVVGNLANQTDGYGRPKRKSFTSGNTLTARYKTSAGTAFFRDRFMELTPIRYQP